MLGSTGIIARTLAGIYKGILEKKIKDSPEEHHDQFAEEMKRVLAQFINSLTTWEEKAGKDFQNIAVNKKISSNKESKQLDHANVRVPLSSHYSTTHCPKARQPLQALSYCRASKTAAEHASWALPSICSAYGTADESVSSANAVPADASTSRTGNVQRKWKRTRKGKGWIQSKEATELRRVKTRSRSHSSRNIKRAIVKSSDNLLLEQIENIMTVGVANYQLHNLTSDVLTAEEQQCLAYGINFIPVPKTNSNVIDDAFNSFQNSTRLRWHFKDSDEKELSPFYIPTGWKVPSTYLHEPIETALNILHKSLHEIKPQICSNNWPSTYDKALRNMLSKPDRMLITSDKNLGYVYVSVDWYRKQVQKHLNDQLSYKDESSSFEGKDCTNRSIDIIYQRLCVMIHRFKDSLDEDEIKWIIHKKEWKLMKFYLTAKIHKHCYDFADVPGRPIVPSMTWITHNLSIWITHELKPYVDKAKTVLKDSAEVVRRIENSTLQKRIGRHNKNIWLISADIVALYPNIDIGRGLERIKDHLVNAQYENPLRQAFLMKAIEFVLTNGFMEFEGRIFRQINGAAMGSPMIPAYANLFMYETELNIVTKWQGQGLLSYNRYIDDNLSIFEGTTQDLERFKNAMNTMDPAIKWTFTISQSSVDFLDLTIIFDSHNGRLLSTVYQKALNKYAYLPWHSYHTKDMKAGFIKGEAMRYARLCGRFNDFLSIINLFVIRLQRRGYPLKFILHQIAKVNWYLRSDYLQEKVKENIIPYIFKIEYNPSVSKQSLREALDQFTEQLNDTLQSTPSKSNERITICFKLPPKVHKIVLAARKSKGF